MVDACLFDATVFIEMRIDVEMRIDGGGYNKLCVFRVMTGTSLTRYNLWDGSDCVLIGHGIQLLS